MKELAALVREETELQVKRLQLKQLALQHRDEQNENGLISDNDELNKINERMVELQTEKTELQNQNRQSEENQNKREINNIMNKIQNYKEEMRAEEVIETEEYRSAFFKRLRGLELNDLEKRAMTTTNNSAVIPTTTMDMIIGKLQSEDTLLADVYVANVPSLTSFPIANVMNDAEWIAEAVAGTSKDDTTRKVELAAYKLIRLIEISAETQTMSVSAFETWIVDTMVKKMKIGIEASIAKGSGAGQPTGLDKATFDATNSLTTAVAKVISYDEVVDAESLVGEDYINSARWYMNRKTLAMFMKITDTNKKPIFERAIEDGFRGTILGIPVKLSRHITDSIAYLGDLKSAYVLNFSKGIEISSDSSAGYTKATTVYRGLALLDGKPTNIKDALIKLTVKAGV